MKSLRDDSVELRNMFTAPTDGSAIQVELVGGTRIRVLWNDKAGAWARGGVLYQNRELRGWLPIAEQVEDESTVRREEALELLGKAYRAHDFWSAGDRLVAVHEIQELRNYCDRLLEPKLLGRKP